MSVVTIEEIRSLAANALFIYCIFNIALRGLGSSNWNSDKQAGRFPVRIQVYFSVQIAIQVGSSSLHINKPYQCSNELALFCYVFPRLLES